MRRGPSGFSLVELILALGLTLLVLALGIIQTRPTSGAVDTKAVAMQVAAELRAAHLRAVTQKVPVAVVFPSLDGTCPLSRSLYNLEGLTRAKITRTLDLSSRRCFMFVGMWPLDSARLRDPSKTNQLLPPPRTPWKVEGWARNPTPDYTFMFTPDGKLLTNDLPGYDGNYHILVASAADFAAAPRPSGSPTVTLPPGYFNLTGVSDPVTLTLTPSGSVSLKPGLLAGGEVPKPVGPQVLGSDPITPASMPNTPPEIDGIKVYPEPVEGTADGFDAVLAPQSQLTLRVRASDPDGDLLTCQWISEPITTTRPGTFSIPNRVALTPGRSKSWNWTPPPDATTGDEFRLVCSVKDDLGAEVALTGNAAIDVMVRDTGTVVFQKPDANGKARLWTCCGDGTAAQVVDTGLRGSNVHSARFSANGSKLVFQSDISGNQDVYYANRDGSGRVELLTYATDEVDPSWNNNGTWVAFSQAPPPEPSPTPYASPAMPVLRKLQADKGKVFTLLKAGGWDPGAFNPVTQMAGCQPTWSKDGKLIAFISTESGSPDLWVVKADGSGLTNLTEDTFNDQRPRFAPDSDTLMWLSDRSGVMQVYTLQVSNPTNIVQRTDSSTPKVEACFSPRYSDTGGQILLVEDDGTKVHLIRADMPAAGLCTDLVDLQLPGLDRLLGVRPDWGK